MQEWEKSHSCKLKNMKRKKIFLWIIIGVVLCAICIAAIVFKKPQSNTTNNTNNTNNNQEATLTPTIDTTDIDAIQKNAHTIEETDEYTEYSVEGTFLDIKGNYNYRISNGEIIYSEFRYIPMLVRAKEVQQGDEYIGVYDETELAEGYKATDDLVKFLQIR